MKKIVIIFIIILNSFNVQCQEFKGYVVTNENDTIKCKFIIETNLFNKNIAYFNYIRRKITIVNELNEKVTYKPYELISFNVEYNGDNKFISVQNDNYSRFFHEVLEGKISLLVIYERSMSQYRVGDTPYYYLLKDNILTDLSLGGHRNEIGVLFEDYPQLHKDWMDKKYKTKDYVDVIKKYNEYFKN